MWSWGRAWQAANVAGVGESGSQTGDLVVLGSEAGQGQAFEVAELDEGLVAAGESFCEGGKIVFEPGDVGVAGIWVLAGVGGSLEAALELEA